MGPRTLVSAALAALVGAGILAMAGCGDDDSGVSPDTTAPVITAGPSVALLTTGAATIVWTTNEASNSVVRYGPDTTYAFAASDPTLGTAHQVTIASGLEPDSTVYYRVESTDAASNTVRSGGFSLVPPVATLSFAPDSVSTAVAGGPFSVDLDATALSDVFGATFFVSFDSTVVRCDSITPGAFLGSPASLVWLGVPGSGRADIGVARQGTADGVSGDGTLAVFHFTPLAAGSFTLAVDTLELRDPGAADMANLDEMEITPGFIEVTGP